MTRQDRKTAKVEFLCRVTTDNYDFLYRVAKQHDISLAKALNLAVSQFAFQTNTANDKRG